MSVANIEYSVSALLPVFIQRGEHYLKEETNIHDGYGNTQRNSYSMRYRKSMEVSAHGGDGNMLNQVVTVTYLLAQ